MYRTIIGPSVATFFASSQREFSPRRRHVGEGQKRAAQRLHEHREKQAARVEPALADLAEKRAAMVNRRFQRWTLNVDMECDAPGSLKPPRHIHPA